MTKRYTNLRSLLGLLLPLGRQCFAEWAMTVETHPHMSGVIIITEDRQTDRQTDTEQ